MDIYQTKTRTKKKTDRQNRTIKQRIFKQTFFLASKSAIRTTE
jgi:hypothetical protein